MKIDSSNDINKKKLFPLDDKPKIVIPEAWHDNPRMLTDKHNDEKLGITVLIVEARLIAHYFL